jgi:DNA-binding transcriptional ArsR family regulator
MTTPVATSNTVPASLHPDKAALLKAIGSPLRGRMLAELSSGEPHMVNELARKAGCTPATASKHLALLRRAGLIVLTRRTYQIPRHFIVNAELGHLDYGHCLLRLNPAVEPPAA